MKLIVKILSELRRHKIKRNLIKLKHRLLRQRQKIRHLCRERTLSFQMRLISEVTSKTTKMFSFEIRDSSNLNVKLEIALYGSN